MSDDEDEGAFTHPQWEAARLLIARARSEAAGDEFDLEELGITWIEVDNLVCAFTDSGAAISVGDILHASIVLLWSAISAASDYGSASPAEIVARLGLGLAAHEPVAD